MNKSLQVDDDSNSIFAQALDLSTDESIEESQQTQIEIKNEAMNSIQQEDLTLLSNRF